MAKAPVGKRIVAFLIDNLITGLIIAVPIIILAVAMIGISFVSAKVAGIAGFLMLPLSGILVLVAFAYMLVRDGLNGGRSYGKKFMKLKVLKDGQPCTMKDSIMRNLTLTVGCLLFVLPTIDMIIGLVDKDGLRIGDKIAHTQVVEG